MNRENVKSVVISVFFAEFAALLFLFLFALITYTKEDPSKYSENSGILGLLIGALTCSIISSILSKRKNTNIPIISGAIYCTLQIVTALLWSNNDFNLFSVFYKVLLMMGICVLSSYCIRGRNKKKKHRKVLSKR